MTTCITFTRLSKRFGQRQILNNTRLTLRTGECVLLTGKNGTGKTTLMRILSGLEKPEQCEIEVSNPQRQCHYQWRQYRSTLQRSMMYLHQQPYMFSGDVLRNLNFALPRRLSRAERQARIQEISAWAGLDDLLQSNAKSLSGGECQRVAIARALLRNPQALLLDEPTASMDTQSRERTLEMLQRLQQQNIALLIASHDPGQFSTVASRFIHLEQQQITPLADGAVTMSVAA